MRNFNYSTPTQIFFGKDQINVLSEQIRIFGGSRVLLVYGGGSIKRIGLYDKVLEILKTNDLSLFELGGIDPNPRIESVRQGIKICRDNNLDFVLAVGGGSSIDCAKLIAAGFYYESDPWNLMIGKAKCEKTLPLGSILTLSATGSEMDNFSVISNLEAHQKIGLGNAVLVPKFSILDPTYTYSVPKKQTAAGTADIMSHTIENYFTVVKGAYLQSRLAEGILKTCIQYAPIALEDPENYEARANLMWSSSLAINGLLSYGKERNWSCHPMEHELSAYYDITHGEGLAILTPYWMEYVLNDATVEQFKDYGINVWGLKPNEDPYIIAQQAITKTREFFVSLGLPSTLRDVNIGEENLKVMAKAATKKGTIGEFRPLTTEDVYNIYKSAL
ncbi:iron-containing alcohol dehydrogenase [Desulfitobacterium metallireducens]|uniref:NADH-dependent butanol dehydrogenase A n=1 Tax=Desulfitobacterium metallireducens DSM 15288 TaxID=871968 RepID=W0E7S0_9FIRM|nr:iron-containing alcohol dehydrogenase [Desulfitobacterium metallireducens]AHF06812.1 NADH-dependent butanol dehydrogenase A [Desulfitobacterium metallireducens DSM 15288]